MLRLMLILAAIYLAFVLFVVPLRNSIFVFLRYDAYWWMFPHP